jgi:predicted GIY-YIG superfamily endonuclease
VSKKWMYEAVQAEASKHRTRVEFKRAAPGAYRAAHRDGIIDEVCAHMTKGQMGSPRQWTQGKVRAEALKHPSRIAFCRNASGAYNAARQLGILDEVCSHMIAPASAGSRCIYKITVRNTDLLYIGLTYNFHLRINQHLRAPRFTKLADRYGSENILAEQISEYLDKDEAAILEQELIDQFNAEGYRMLNRAKGGATGGGVIQWDKKAILENAKKYTKNSEWRRNSAGARGAARKAGIYKEATAHMDKVNAEWAEESVMEEARKYLSRNAFQRNARGAYQSAKRLGIYEEAVAHMSEGRPHRWDRESVLADAKKYSKRSDWKLLSAGAYAASQRLGIYKEATAHMGRLRAFGGYEKAGNK